jgi:CheY-like chemotaxis protein
MIRDCVLVIDDDRDFRDLASIVLAGSGLVGLQAGSCPEAVPILARERARLRAVLLDYFMPGPPPRECARTVLAAVDPEVPVILVSAAVDIAERAAELGLTRFLAKPFEVRQLVDAVIREAPAASAP